MPTRLVRRAFELPLLGRFLIWIAADVDPLLHSLTRGRFGLRIPMPFASLTTTGAKTGQPRTNAVLYFHDGDDVILVASNYGTARHPGWYHNLKANPQALLERGGRAGRYTASELTDERERERMFTLVNVIYPGFARYRVQTAAIGRRIPIMRLRPAM